MTVVAVAAVVAGPSTIECARTADMAACLRDKASAIGLLPASPAAPAAQTADPALVAEVPAAPESAKGPALELLRVEPENGEVTPEIAAPALELLRAEPDGSVIIAGKGAPGKDIEVFANGELFGTTTAEPSGDWALVPEIPLPAGGTAITVGEAGSESLGERSFVVVVSPDKMAAPQVIETTPAEAEQVIRQAAVPMADITPVGERANAEVAAAVEAPTTVAPPAVAEAPAAPDLASTDDRAREEVALALAQPAEIAAPAVPATPAVVPTIDAIEIEGSANFIAGAGEEGATIRVYIDDAFAGESPVQGGRWLVEAQDMLTAPSQRIRADMLRDGSDEVVATAEVNFEVDLPEAVPVTPETDVTMVAERARNEVGDALADAIVAEAEAEGLAVAAAPAVGAVEDRAQDEAAAAAAEPLAVASAAAVPAPDLSAVGDRARDEVAAALDDIRTVVVPEFASAETEVAATEAPAAPVAPPAEPAAPALDVADAGDRAREEAAAALADIRIVPVPEPVVAEEPEIAAAEPEAAPTELAAVETPEEAVPTIRAEPIGDPEDMRFASSKVIIRRGDTLWHIARRVYGRGIHYWTIFHANDDVIRQPGLIYPGQVFDLPETPEPAPY